jgi:hypothetical protein
MAVWYRKRLSGRIVSRSLTSIGQRRLRIDQHLERGGLIAQFRCHDLRRIDGVEGMA